MWFIYFLIYIYFVKETVIKKKKQSGTELEAIYYLTKWLEIKSIHYTQQFSKITTETEPL